VRFSALKTEEVQLSVNKLADKDDKGTVKLYFQKFNVAMKYACKPNIRHLINNPCDDVIVNKPDSKEKAVWDDRQSKTFIRFCKTSASRYASMFILLLNTGARIGEILALHWTDVDLDVGIIQVTKTAPRKGKSHSPKSSHSIRKVPIDPFTVKILMRHKARQNKEKLMHGEGYNPENFVFVTKPGNKVLYIIAYRSFEICSKKAALPYITIHGMRHTHATMLLKHGHSVNAVAERIGDSAETVIRTYAHVTPGMHAEMVKTIEQTIAEEGEI
jgi:integrase